MKKQKNKKYLFLLLILLLPLAVLLSSQNAAGAAMERALEIVAPGLFPQESGDEDALGEGARLSRPIPTGASPDSPLWLRVEVGKNAIRARELGEALSIFRTILSEAEQTGAVIPEAEMGVASIYQEEGELELARLEYLKALEHADSLYIPEDRFVILYNLAEIYSLTSRFADYEKTLLRIIAEGSGTAAGVDEESVAYHEAAFNALLRNNLDRLFVLYRRDERNIQNAYSALGQYYYRTGYYRESLRYLSSALISIVTAGADYRRGLVFDYQFTTLTLFITEAREYPQLKNFLEESLFYEDLYYLGAALYALGEPPRARQAWQALADGLPDDAILRGRAVRQLAAPYVEPLLGG